MMETEKRAPDWLACLEDFVDPSQGTVLSKPFGFYERGESWVAASNKWLVVAFRVMGPIPPLPDAPEAFVNWYHSAFHFARSGAPHLVGSLRDLAGDPVVREQRQCNSCGGRGIETVEMDGEIFDDACENCDHGIRTVRFPYRPMVIDGRAYNANGIAAVLRCVQELTVKLHIWPDSPWPTLLAWSEGFAAVAGTTYDFPDGSSCYETKNGAVRPWAKAVIR